jgi:hypothetical protein
VLRAAHANRGHSEDKARPRCPYRSECHEDETMWQRAAVHELNHNGVSDLGANDRAQNSEPLGLRLSDRKTSVCVFGCWHRNPVRWYAPLCALGMSVFWVAAAMGE